MHTLKTGRVRRCSSGRDCLPRILLGALGVGTLLVVHAERASALTPQAAGQEENIVAPSDLCASPQAIARAYPGTAHTAEQIAQMITRPTDQRQLLSNLKIVLDGNLLSEPAFFDDAVLTKLFNASEIRWGEAAAGDITGDWLVKPARIASVRSSGALSGLKVEVGYRRRCLASGPHDVTAPKSGPYSYHAGYIAVRGEESGAFPLGAVLGTFGHPAKRSDHPCAVFPRLSYQSTRRPSNPLDDPFTYNAAEFYVGDVAADRGCAAAKAAPQSDADPVSLLSIRLVERDGTLPRSSAH